MARPKNPPEKVKHMQNMMMDAAIELLDEVPPEKVSIRMIAEKIGMSHMVFYTYFNNRAEFMEALVERQSNQIEKHFDGLIEKAKQRSVKDVLIEFVDAYMRSAKDHPKIFYLVWISESAAEKGSPKSIKHLEPLFYKLADLLKFGMEKGEFHQRNPLTAAVTVLSSLNAPILMDICNKIPSGVDCEELFVEIKQEVLTYISS